MTPTSMSSGADGDLRLNGFLAADAVALPPIAAATAATPCLRNDRLVIVSFILESSFNVEQDCQ